MNILIIGSNGQLGTDMVELCRRADHKTTGIDFPAIDITDFASTHREVLSLKPDAIINCSAYTAVDGCEAHEDAAYAVNAIGSKNLALCAQESGSILVHFSTDYVFDGLATRPYVESDKPNPATAYGRTKLAGETFIAALCPRHFIFRIAWLYGVHGNNFVKTIRKVAIDKKEKNEALRVVNDQFGTPTWTRDVCTQILPVITTEHFGVFHATSEGECSWFDFAQEIVLSAGVEVRVEPCTTAEFVRPAPRPAYSVLENRRLKTLGLNTMPSWKQGFRGFLRQEHQNTL